MVLQSSATTPRPLHVAPERSSPKTDHGSVQGQARVGLEQAGPEEGVTPHGMKLE